jgi:hypothetical protein
VEPRAIPIQNREEVITVAAQAIMDVTRDAGDIRHIPQVWKGLQQDRKL